MRSLVVAVVVFVFVAVEAICPIGCVCNENTVHCRQWADGTLRALRRLSIHTFPSLQYLIADGARLGDLDNGVFESFSSMPQLHFVNLTDCGITAISSKTFADSPIRSLTLSHNPIRTIRPETLRRLQHLEVLELNRVFDAHRENNQIALKNLFHSAPNSLRFIHLNSNSMKFDVTQFFCKFNRLFSVDLNDNLFEKFDFAINCSVRIDKLNLSKNRLSQIPKLETATVDSLDISENPLNCEFTESDCSVVLPTLENSNKTFCFSPSWASGREFGEVRSEFCNGNSSSGLLIVFCSLLFVLFLFVILRIGLCEKKGKKAEGYDRVEMAEVEAEFV